MKASFSASWTEIENIISHSLPSCVKTILSATGYDSLLSINLINEIQMFEVEQFVNENRNITAKLECCFADTYRNLRKFRFLPGHRLLILQLPSYVNVIFERNQAAKSTDENQQHAIMIATSGQRDTSRYSFLLKMLIDSADENAGVAKNRYRYDDFLQLFSSYIFLSSGRSCYETLSKNLPIPSKYTICKWVV